MFPLAAAERIVREVGRELPGYWAHLNIVGPEFLWVIAMERKGVRVQRAIMDEALWASENPVEYVRFHMYTMMAEIEEQTRRETRLHERRYVYAPNIPEGLEGLPYEDVAGTMAHAMAVELDRRIMHEILTPELWEPAEDLVPVSAMTKDGWSLAPGWKAA